MPEIDTSAPSALEEASDYVAESSFEDLPLSDELRRGIAERGYARPTPVQARTFRPVLAGKDLIVRSKTGTGKTAAFGLPLLERIEAGAHRVKAMVLCPTRELALQVCDEITALAAHKDLRVVAIYGGASIKAQTDALRAGAEFVVGTPGRVYDLIRRKELDLSTAQSVVLDEADEMLNQGFYEEVTRILEHMPAGRQTLLFSATISPDIERLIARFTKDPETVLLSGDTFTVEGIENVIYYTVDAYPKPRNLLYLVEKEEPDTAIIFCNTRDDTSMVTAVLNRNGYDAEVLNGDLPQKERERVMGRVKAGELRMMVATDIAARGIDISDLTHVINYSLPEDPAVYLHRVGRTGRIGKKGTAISLVSGRELVTLTTLEKKYGITFEERKLPTPEEAQGQWTERHVAELKDAAQGSVFESMVPLAQGIKSREDSDFIVAFLLKYFFTHHRMDKAQAQGKAPAEKISTEERERRPEREGRREERRPRREERPRHEDRPRRESAPRSADTAQSEAVESGDDGIKLWVNLGLADKLDGPGVVKAVTEAAGIDAAAVSKVELRPTHAYLYATPDLATSLEAANGKAHAGKALRVERARRR